MHDAFVRQLRPVLRRTLTRSIFRAVVAGTVVGSLVSVVVMLARPTTAAIPWALAALLVGPAIGSVVGLWRRPSPRDAAALVDDHYRWQDSTTSALEFSAEPDPAPFMALQVRKALERLSEAQPREVVPLKAPRGWPLAAVSLALAAAIMAWPLVSNDVQAKGPELKPFGPALEEARELEKDARQIEAEAKLDNDPALQAMLAKIRQTIEDLKQPGLDMKQTMAKLSSLEAAIAAQQKELNIAVADRQLQSLGSALAEAKPLEPAGQKLQESQFDQAAQELEKAGDASIAEGEARTVERLASQAAKDMKSKGLEQLGKATQKLAEGIKAGGKPHKDGTKNLAKEIRDHERRRRINKLMAQEQKRLQDCKDRCETRNLVAKLQQEKAEAAKNKKNQAANESVADSTKKEDQEPEKSAHRGDQMKLQGLAGDGPSEKDGEIIGEGGRKASQRPSPRVHKKFEQISEAALEQEPIPLGHRRAIRRYFELIRPTSGTDTEPTSAAPAEGKPPG